MSLKSAFWQDLKNCSIKFVQLLSFWVRGIHLHRGACFDICILAGRIFFMAFTKLLFQVNWGVPGIVLLLFQAG